MKNLWEKFEKMLKSPIQVVNVKHSERTVIPKTLKSQSKVYF